MSILDDLKLDKEVKKEVERQLKILEFKTVEITPKDEFIKMLAHSLQNNKPLRVKCGIDPTGSDVHLGHSVPYGKMRQFQDLGHIGVVVIGDYTAQIGDPSGKNESRPSLSSEDVKRNSQKYLEQVYKVVDPKKTEVRNQSEWFSKVGLADVMSWAHQTTVAKLLSHDTFKHRVETGASLGLHELFYPVLQGIDSVYIKSDVELGGSDQKFNVLMGRDYQKNANMRPQVAMLLPIIHGTCGTQKMSKSLHNYIGILDGAFDQFGKVMSIPDKLMVEWANYASTMNEEEFFKFSAALNGGSLHPNEAKKQLAVNIVSIFHGSGEAAKAREQFEQVFAKKLVPDEIEEFHLKADLKLFQFLVDAKACASNGEARRLITQNAVSVMDGDKLASPDLVIDKSFKDKVIKVGKRKFIKVVI